jgi:hypothetical protein
MCNSPEGELWVGSIHSWILIILMITNERAMIEMKRFIGEERWTTT